MSQPAPRDHDRVRGGAEESGGDPLEALTRAVSELADRVRGDAERAAARERVIDNLHTEVERLRVGEQGLLLRPLIVDLRTLRADLLRQVRSLPERMERPQVAGLLDSFALTVEMALERCGEVPLRPEPGERFVPREHRAVKVLPAARPEQDGAIAAVVADGYQESDGGRVTVPARVHIYRWDGGGADHRDSDSVDEENSADV